MKLGEVVAHIITTTSSSFIKIGLEIKKSFINGPFSLISLHLFPYSLIFAYLLLNDLALSVPNNKNILDKVFIFCIILASFLRCS